MLKIGLTGGIGSGKTTVANFLRDIGIKVIDADMISREVLNIYEITLELIEKEFGKDVINEDGTLNRRKLGNIVFKEKSEKEKLESITIPFIKKEIFKKLKEYEENGEKICVLDAPTLIENRLNEDMDYNILVWVSEDIQIQRVMKRDELSLENVMCRISSQMSAQEKKKYVDFVIDNSGYLENTLGQLKEVLGKINERF